jgi:hypothetical protein
MCSPGRYSYAERGGLPRSAWPLGSDFFEHTDKKNGKNAWIMELVKRLTAACGFLATRPDNKGKIALFRLNNEILMGSVVYLSEGNDFFVPHSFAFFWLGSE